MLFFKKDGKSHQSLWISFLLHQLRAYLSYHTLWYTSRFSITSPFIIFDLCNLLLILLILYRLLTYRKHYRTSCLIGLAFQRYNCHFSKYFIALSLVGYKDIRLNKFNVLTALFLLIFLVLICIQFRSKHNELNSVIQLNI